LEADTGHVLSTVDMQLRGGGASTNDMTVQDQARGHAAKRSSPSVAIMGFRCTLIAAI
jgi:hypothetical protein